MINNVVLVGRLTRDVELRYTATGTAVGSFTVALDRPFTNQNGEKETDFINCVVWRKTAESMANHTGKGSLVGINGRIQTRNYTNDAGQKIYVTEVVAEGVKFHDFKKDRDSASNNQQNYSNDQSNQNKSTNQNSGDTLDISDDDLPF